MRHLAEIIKIFGVGHIMSNTKEYFRLKTVALARGNIKHKHFFHLTEDWAIVVGNSVYLLKSQHPIVLDPEVEKQDQQLRQETLKKLTQEEKRVLGIAE